MVCPKIIEGYCPELDCEMDITVNFTEIRVVGMKTPGYKKTSFDCDYASENECKTAGNSGEKCPLFMTASY